MEAMSTKERELSADGVRSLFDYNRTTGDLIWRVHRGRGVVPGTIAGTVAQTGYIVITYNKRKYLAHRLAWMHVHRHWPKRGIDHINGRRDDNRLVNLREATQSQNHCNMGRSPNNTSGFKGVSWYKKSRRWRAHIQLHGRQKDIGFFDTREEAAAAYAAAARELHGKFARIS